MTKSAPFAATAPRAPTQPTPRAPIRLALSLLALVFALVALSPTTARAADPGRVLALNVDGSKISQVDRDAALTAIKTKLGAYPNLTLVKAPEGDITDQMIDLECIDLDADCLGKLAAKYQAARVVHVDIGKKGRNLVLHLRVIASDSAIVLDQTHEAKDLTALNALIDQGIEAAFGALPVAVANGTLVVEVDAPNAAIYLGTDFLGSGTATAELAPGEYTLRVSHAGSEEVIRKVRVVSAETTTERVALTAVAVVPPVTPVKPDPDEADSGAGWVLWVIIGAAVVGGTIAAIALAQDSDDPTVRGPAVLGIDPMGAWRDPVTFGGRK